MRYNIVPYHAAGRDDDAASVDFFDNVILQYNTMYFLVFWVAVSLYVKYVRTWMKIHQSGWMEEERIQPNENKQKSSFQYSTHSFNYIP